VLAARNPRSTRACCWHIGISFRLVDEPRPDPALDEQPFWLLGSLVPRPVPPVGVGPPPIKQRLLSLAYQNGHRLVLSDGSVVPIGPDDQRQYGGRSEFLCDLDDYSTWVRDVGPGGFFATYHKLFGDRLTWAIEPLVPANLVQPPMALPFGPGEAWFFTGGPHLAWLDGTPYGALDFAPPGNTQCGTESDAWVTAVADGVVTRTGNGEVMLDLDGDGNEGSGWDVLYMHIETRDRVQPAQKLRAGDRIGHPSCEGGDATGVHVHMARNSTGNGSRRLARSRST